MPDLFVDVDDTLILWQDARGAVLPGTHPYGHGADHWAPNVALLDALRRTAPQYATVTIWSGGGAEYAREFVTMLDIPHTRILDKDPGLCGPDDLCVDDDGATWRFPCRCITADEFIAAEAFERSLRDGRG